MENRSSVLISIVAFLFSLPFVLANDHKNGLQRRHHNYTQYKQHWTPPSVCRIDYSNGTSENFGCFLDDLFDCEPYEKPSHSHNHDGINSDRRSALWNRLDDLFDDFWGYRSYQKKSYKRKHKDDDDDDGDRRVDRVYRCVPRDCSNDDEDACPSQYYSTCEKYHRYPWRYETDKKSGDNDLGFGGHPFFGQGGVHHHEHHSSWHDHHGHHHSHSSHHDSHHSHGSRSHRRTLDDDRHDDHDDHDYFMSRCTVPSGLAGVRTACRISFDNGTTLFERPCWSSNYWRDDDDDHNNDDRSNINNKKLHHYRKHYTSDYVCGNDDNNNTLIQINGENRLLTFCYRENDDEDGRHYHNDPWRFPWRTSSLPFSGFFRS